MATGGDSDGSIAIWDLRKAHALLNDLEFHKQQVTGLEWHPSKEQILVSASDDGKCYVWDNAKCGEEIARQDYEDGPPELVFPHEMHKSKVEEVCWNPRVQDDTLFPMIASVENQEII